MGGASIGDLNAGVPAVVESPIATIRVREAAEGIVRARGITTEITEIAEIRKQIVLCLLC